MFQAFYKDVRLTEALSRLLLSPKFIGAALLFLGCFLYVVRDYSPDWRLEKRKGVSSRQDSPTSEILRPSKNNFLLVPFVPLAFVYLLIRLIRGLFRIGVFCSVDGFLWILTKLPLFFLWYSRQVFQLPKVVKSTFPQYWDRYIIIPSTAILDYSLEVFFPRIVGKSNIAFYLTFGLIRRKVLNILSAFYYICQALHPFFIALYNSFLGPFYQTCKVIISYTFFWIHSHGSYLRKSTFKCFQAPNFDLVYDLGELFLCIWGIMRVIRLIIRPTTTRTLYSLKTFSKRTYRSCSNKILNTISVWETYVQNCLLPASLRINRFYRQLTTTIWRCSLRLIRSLRRLLHHSLKVTIRWIWSTAIPISRRFITRTSILFYKFAYSILFQAYRSTKYLYNDIVEKASASISRYVVSTLLQLYLVVHNVFWELVVFTRSKALQLWIPSRDRAVYTCKQVIPLTVQGCRKVREAIRLMCLYTIKRRLFVSLNAQSLVISLKPLCSLVGELYKSVHLWSLQAVKRVRLILKMAYRTVRLLLEKAWPMLMEYSVQASNFILKRCTQLVYFITESYCEVQPVFVTWKETIVYAADEVIQHMGKVLIDEMKSFKSKWE